MPDQPMENWRSLGDLLRDPDAEGKRYLDAEAVADLVRQARRNPVADFLMERPPSRDGMPDSSLRIGVKFEAGEDHAAYESWGWVVQRIIVPDDPQGGIDPYLDTIAEDRSLDRALALARERLPLPVDPSPAGDSAESGAAQGEVTRGHPGAKVAGARAQAHGRVTDEVADLAAGEDQAQAEQDLHDDRDAEAGSDAAADR